jgi:hypothetical protein
VPVFPLDETLSSEQAGARIDTLRNRAEHVAALRNAASNGYLEASQT